MAGWTDFHPSLQGWLQAVWRDRSRILFEAAAPSAEPDEGMWQVYDLYNVPGSQPVHNDEFRAFIDECVEFQKYGFICSAQKGDVVPNDFYHFDRLGHAERRAAGDVSMADRIYAHTKAPVNGHALPLIKILLQMAQGYDGIVKLKVAGPGLPAARKDTIVVWLQHDYAVQYVLRRMKQRDFTDHYGGDTPPGIKVVVPGLGVGKEPPEIEATHPVAQASGGTTKHSYGMYVASGIFLALRTSRPHGPDPGRFLDKVLRVFQEIGINPKIPHMIQANNQDMTHMNFVANHTLVAHHRSAGDLILNDHSYNTDPTRPFRTAREPVARRGETVMPEPLGSAGAGGPRTRSRATSF